MYQKDSELYFTNRQRWVFGQTNGTRCSHRNLEIIGEATKHLEQGFRSKYPAIEWKKIAGMRDKLIYDYIGVDLWAVWGVVEQIIPQFHEQILQIIEMEKDKG